MIFDLGCCCSNIITGYYDFYGLGSYESFFSYPVFNDAFDIEQDNIFTRQASRRVNVGDDPVFPETFAFRHDTFPNGTNRITSLISDWYVNFASGTGIGDSRFGEENNSAIAVNGSIEKAWMYRLGVYDHTDIYNAFGYNINSGIGTGWTLGSGAVIQDNKLVSTSTGVTSDVWMYKELPTGEFPSYLRFQLPRTYDKYILLTTSTTEDNPESYSGYNIWINTTAPQTEYVKPVNLDYGLGTFVPSVRAYPVGDYISYTIEFDHLLFTNPTPYFDFSPVTSLKITLVDNQSGYTLDDVSGFNAEFREMYFSFGNITGNYDYVFQDVDLTLFNCVDKVIEKQFKSSTGIFISNSITGTDFARINRIAGFIMSESAFLGGSVGIDNYSTRNDWHTTTNLQCFGGYDEYDFTDVATLASSGDYGTLFTYQSGNVIIPYQHANIFTSTTILNSDGRTIAFTSFEHDKSNHEDSATINVATFNYSRGTLNINNYYDSILEYSVNGGRNYIFGENLNMTSVELEIPESEKQNLYIKGLSGIPADIDNYNTDVYLPRINIFAQKKYPYCFSVKQPKPSYFYGTGESGLLSQDISITYGPYETGNYPITTLGAYTGTNMILGGYTGIPYTTFTYGPSFSLITGVIYTINRKMLHGSTTGETLWSDSFSQNRQAFNDTIVGTIGGPWPTGLYSYGAERVDFTNHVRPFPNLGAQILFADVKDETPGMIFAHSRNFGTNSNQSGEAYIKVQIGSNIILNERVWANAFYLPQSQVAMARGLVAVTETETSQKANMTGQGAAFVWFEKLWANRPSISHTGDASGWRMHVANITGSDLWTLDSTGYHANYGDEYPRTPNVVATSDRFIYVNDFYLPHKGCVSDDFLVTSIYPTGYTGFAPTSGDFYYACMTGSYINAGQSFGISHDGRSVLPIGIDYEMFLTHLSPLTTGFIRTSKVGNPPMSSYGVNFGGSSVNISDLYVSDSVKNSDSIPYCPPYSQFIKETGFITYVSPFPGNATGMGLAYGDYISGYVIIGSGIINSGVY